MNMINRVLYNIIDCGFKKNNNKGEPQKNN